MKIIIGYEDVYFGNFYKVGELSIDRYDKDFIIKEGRKLLPENNKPYLAWKVVK